MPNIISATVGMMQTNCYAVLSDQTDEAVVIDAGRNGYASIAKALRQYGRRAVALLCTHGHFDHVWDCACWEKDGVPVYLHKGDIELISGEKDLFDGFKLDIPRFDVAHYVEDEEVIRFSDLVFTARHTPGHSKGSVCYLLNDDTLFSGDTLFYHSFGRVDLYGGEYSSLVRSINDLLHIEGDRRVLPGHGESTTLVEERMFNPLYVK